MKSIAQLISEIVPDPWRAAVGFSKEVEAVHRDLFDPRADNAKREAAINAWIANYQPCLFGRMAARANAITYCILTHEDLASSDEEIRAKLRLGKLKWRQAAYNRESSALVVLFVSDTIATALPNETIQLLAQRLGFLYLDTVVLDDARYLDRVGLELPQTTPQQLYEFKVGVDYFAAHGDGRWWHDHRIPGGIGLSLNSPGHLILSGQIEKLAKLSELAPGTPAERDLAKRVTSPERGLELAMRTIWTATKATSGKATWLLPRDPSEPRPTCAADLPRDLAEKSCRAYGAYYDTDWTLRSAFFRPDVVRPAEVAERQMDLTYFYDKSAQNEDSDLVEGVRVRQDERAGRLNYRQQTVHPTIVNLLDNKSLAGLES